ncbi:hypothetical protein H5395_15525 [Paracoccus sp. MC1854]|uniref:hypothetical protein n=1 Tax=Paracoccus sp. MC1854 TaxID=2760306 RepID=UPI001601906F|nr:hypothetical protein [Paracoccus sp. MC1854]MBB1492904.1 hypothetical protein [Paracoccus sp. MC1854]
MTQITFGRLSDLSPREAWPHEAHSFTPWLAQNIDQLAEVIGIPLELTGTEIAVETFAADILARNADDGTVVLIENQLEQTDHTHLGQIMTYLAGLDAQTVIWIAPRFREPHLSAIRWLNAHTTEGFGFFAVRLRVVRIGDSPYAPVFEVVEKPSNWDRKLQRLTGWDRSPKEVRAEYWRTFDERFPNSRLQEWGEYRFAYVDADEDLFVSLFVNRDRCGICVGSESAENWEDFHRLFGGRLRQLVERLGPIGERKDLTAFSRSARGNLMNPESWPEMHMWQHEQLQRYLTALNEVLGGEA